VRFEWSVALRYLIPFRSHFPKRSEHFSAGQEWLWCIWAIRNTFTHIRQAENLYKPNGRFTPTPSNTRLYTPPPWQRMSASTRQAPGGNVVLGSALPYFFPRRAFLIFFSSYQFKCPRWQVCVELNTPRVWRHPQGGFSRLQSYFTSAFSHFEIRVWRLTSHEVWHISLVWQNM